MKTFGDVRWAYIDGYGERYAVSEDGRVWSFLRDKLLKPEVVHNGYLRVNLTDGKKSRHKRIHVLVAQAFIPNPNNYVVVHHLDANKTNNHVDNLEWTTAARNI